MDTSERLHFHFHKGSTLSTLSNLACVCALVTQSCLTLCDPMDCNPPGSSVHGILQARILEWVAIPFSRDQTQVSDITGRFSTEGATREAPKGHLLTASCWWVEIWLHHKNAGGHKPSVDKTTCPLMCYVPVRPPYRDSHACNVHFFQTEDPINSFFFFANHPPPKKKNSS